ncbi:MAG: hypothetical protein K9M45_01980, partial [Kiritimatiellales bacterium]|nr:hypothetical protein [Kiritimatiellales bacterium]
DTGRRNEDGTDLTYPVRAIRTHEYLYVHNYKPERWPVGNPELGLRNCDDSPTKSYLTGLKPGQDEYIYYEMSFGKRPEEQLFQIQKDPACIDNLAGNPEYAAVIKRLRKIMESDLTAQQDPRVLGQGDVFDTYKYMGRPFNYETGQPGKIPKKKKKK